MPRSRRGEYGTALPIAGNEARSGSRQRNSMRMDEESASNVSKFTISIAEPIIKDEELLNTNDKDSLGVQCSHVKKNVRISKLKKALMHLKTPLTCSICNGMVIN